MPLNTSKVGESLEIIGAKPRVAVNFVQKKA